MNNANFKLWVLFCFVLEREERQEMLWSCWISSLKIYTHQQGLGVSFFFVKLRLIQQFKGKFESTWYWLLAFWIVVRCLCSQHKISEYPWGHRLQRFRLKWSYYMRLIDMHERTRDSQTFKPNIFCRKFYEPMKFHSHPTPFLIHFLNGFKMK